MPKLPVERADVQLSGMVGDWQRNRKYHGGPERALCLYSAELLEELRVEGHPVAAGALGENVTIEGLDWRLMRPGVRVRIGSVEAEVTSFTTPCKTIAHAFVARDFTRISERRFPGWSRVYVRIVREGSVALNDAVNILPPGTT